MKNALTWRRIVAGIVALTAAGGGLYAWSQRNEPPELAIDQKVAARSLSATAPGPGRLRGRWIILLVPVVLIGGWLVRNWWNEQPNDVDIDHRTSATVAKPLADKGPPPEPLRRAWRVSASWVEAGSASSFLLVAGQVIVKGHDEIWAYDARTGKPRWKYREADRPFLGVATTKGTVVVITGSTGDGSETGRRNRVLGLDADTGRIRWQKAELWTSYGSNGEGFASNDGIVFVKTPDDLVAVDARTGEARWSKPFETEHCDEGVEILDDANTDGSVLLANECGSERLVGLDPATGSVRWRDTESSGDPVSDFTAADGFAAVTADGDLTVVDRSGDQVGSWGSTDSGIDPELRHVGDHIAVQEGKHTTILDTRTGNATPVPNWRGDFGTVAGSKLYGLTPTAFDDEHAGHLNVPAGLQVLDPATGRVQRMPVMIGGDNDLETEWLGVAGGRVFVGVVDASDDEVTLMSYVPTSGTGPPELGGSRVGDWPNACDLLSDGRPDSAANTGENAMIGSATIPNISCTRDLNSHGDRGIVEIVWVLPPGDTRQDVFPDSPPSTIGADEQCDGCPGRVIRSGRVIASVRVEPHDGKLETELAKDVVRRLRGR